MFVEKKTGTQKEAGDFPFKREYSQTRLIMDIGKRAGTGIPTKLLEDEWKQHLLEVIK